MNEQQRKRFIKAACYEIDKEEKEVISCIRIFQKYALRDIRDGNQRGAAGWMADAERQVERFREFIKGIRMTLDAIYVYGKVETGLEVHAAYMGALSRILYVHDPEQLSKAYLHSFM
jgi:hypothetical protein